MLPVRIYHTIVTFRSMSEAIIAGTKRIYNTMPEPAAFSTPQVHSKLFFYNARGDPKFFIPAIQILHIHVLLLTFAMERKSI